MFSFRVRNVHEALPNGILQLAAFGVDRESRNGKVRMFPEPVSTRYENPRERVLFHADRDANPFFHLYESLWMLAGKRDVKSVAHYVKRMADFSDDGKTFHGAYGYRWKHHFKVDQLAVIIDALNKNPDDRRCVLQMWDARRDLGKEGKDFPCNLSALFSVNHEGKLDMTVYNRSNDMIWGAYGANAVHFSFLQEYMATALGRQVGAYEQVSTNFHAYRATLDPMIHLGGTLDSNPYALGEVAPYPLVWFPEESKTCFDLDLAVYMEKGPITGFSTRFFRKVVTPMHYAHEEYKKGAKTRFFAARSIAAQCAASDWSRAAIEWLNRRESNAQRASA
jgi:thymidylate synthase